MADQKVTRGHGALESMLARLRAGRANALIRPEQRKGRILDVGCGSFPYFLSTTEFAEKFGVDKTITAESAAELSGHATLAHFDVYGPHRLPFPDAHFDVVTMLAVFEHLAVDRLEALIADVHRVLKPGGSYVMTTPAGWTGPILDVLKRIGMVSREEIDEHVDSYSAAKIRAIMGRTPFEREKMRMGYFEAGMNVWMVAGK
jgi:SAM-dependent methyltransferase